MTRIEGDALSAEHFRLGLFTMDWALADRSKLAAGIGMSSRSIVQVIGKPSTGKNTFSYYAAGKLDSRGTIAYLPLEVFEKDYVKSAVEQSGHTGRLRIVPNVLKSRRLNHAERLAILTDYFAEPDGTGAIFDSIGALRGPDEFADSMGDGQGLDRLTRYANSYMGRRAQLVNKFLRDIDGHVQERETVGNVYLMNHVYPGGMGQNLKPGMKIWTSPGGEGKEYFIAVNLHIWQEVVVEEQGCYISKAVVIKNRFGGKGGVGYFAMIPGIGISPGMTALYDCTVIGLAKKSAANMAGSSEITLLGQDGAPDKHMGKVNRYIQAAASRNEDAFEPFVQALQAAEEGMVKVWEREQEQGQEEIETSEVKPKAATKKKTAPFRSSKRRK